MFGSKVDEKATAISLNIPRNSQNLADSSTTNAINVKTAHQQSIISNKAGSVCSPLQPDINVPIVSSGAMPQPPLRLPSEGGNASFPQLQLWQSRNSASERSVTPDKLKDQELALEGGTINISSVYSQG